MTGRRELPPIAPDIKGRMQSCIWRAPVRFRQGVFVAGMASLHQSTASQQLYLDAVKKMTAVMPAREHVVGQQVFSGFLM